MRRSRKHKIGKFNIATLRTSDIGALTLDTARGFIVKERGITSIRLTKEERRQKKMLDYRLNKIYDLNRGMLEEKGIKKDTFINKVKNIMFEPLKWARTKEEAQGMASKQYKAYNLRETLSIISRSTAFSSPTELAMQEIKRAMKMNPEFEAEMRMTFGDSRGRISWSKFQWDKEKKGWGFEGLEDVIKTNRKRKKGDTPRGEGFIINYATI